MYLADCNAQMDWAVATNASFWGRLVWFYANLFSVSVYQGQTAPLVGPFIQEAIRLFVNGNFTDMVLAAESHPATLFCLDNTQSVGPDSVAGLKAGKGLNENLGRECMELHTVGLGAGHTQTDVTNMAKILTGWSVATSDGGGTPTEFKYPPAAHEPGAQTVLGVWFDGGKQAGIDALTFLSRPPSSYKMLAQKAHDAFRGGSSAFG